METLDFREDLPLVDFGPIEDRSRDIIKVIGVGGGGCNAVRNMYNEGIESVTFAVCNTDSKSLASSPVPVKIPLGDTGLGAGANPEIGRKAAEDSIEQIRKLLNDGTKMVFVTAGMGGGTGTGAAPVIAGVAKGMGILTIGIVTIPFYFEKKNKIIKALRGVEEMRKNVDALLIINNERICDIYSDSKVTIKESFRRADQILSDATKSISELITVEGDINLDFCDVETTLRGGGGAIMAMGRARGEHRVEKAVIDALDSPLLYGNDIDKAQRILFNIYTSEEHPLFVSEMNEIDAFMDALDPNIDVIWGVSDDNSLGEDAKVTILATGFEDHLQFELQRNNNAHQQEQYFENLIGNLYKPYKKKVWNFERNEPEVVNTVTVETHEVMEMAEKEIPLTVTVGEEEEAATAAEQPASEQPNADKANTPVTGQAAAVVEQAAPARPNDDAQGAADVEEEIQEEEKESDVEAVDDAPSAVDDEEELTEENFERLLEEERMRVAEQQQANAPASADTDHKPEDAGNGPQNAGQGSAAHGNKPAIQGKPEKIPFLQRARKLMEHITEITIGD